MVEVFYYLIMIIAAFAADNLSSNESRITAELVIILVSTMFFLFRRNSVPEVRRVGFRPVHLFIISYFIVFFQRPLDYLLGFVTQSSYQIGSISLMPICVKYSVIGLICFYIGYLSLRPRVRITNSSTLVKAPEQIFCILTSVFLAAIIVTTPRSVLFGGYSQEFLDSNSLFNYLGSWLKVFIIAYYIQIYINDKGVGRFVGLTPLQFLKKHSPLQLINLSVYTLLILNFGDRGPLIIIVTAICVSYLMLCKKKIKSSLLIVLLVVGVFVTSFLGLTKSFRDGNNIFDRIQAVSASEDTRTGTSVFPMTAELAMSYKCLAYSVETVPSRMDHTYGFLQVSYLLNAIPFSSTIVGTFFDLPENSAYIITRMIQGDYFTSGDGSSCIADLYIDGGLLFIIIGMFLFGISIRFFESRLFSNTEISLFVICLGFHFLIHMVYIPRSIILSPFKYGVWLFFIMYFYHSFYKKKRV